MYDWSVIADIVSELNSIYQQRYIFGNKSLFFLFSALGSNSFLGSLGSSFSLSQALSTTFSSLPLILKSSTGQHVIWRFQLSSLSEKKNILQKQVYSFLVVCRFLVSFSETLFLGLSTLIGWQPCPYRSPELPQSRNSVFLFSTLAPQNASNTVRSTEYLCVF